MPSSTSASPPAALGAGSALHRPRTPRLGALTLSKEKDLPPGSAELTPSRPPDGRSDGSLSERPALNHPGQNTQSTPRPCPPSLDDFAPRILFPPDMPRVVCLVSVPGRRAGPAGPGGPAPYLLSSLRPWQTSRSSRWFSLSFSPTALCSLSFSALTQANSRRRCSRPAVFLERDARNFSFSFC